MFGYLLPRKQDLKVSEYNLYKTVYCSLCRGLQKHFGVAAKFFVNYDFAFLSLIGLALAEPAPLFISGRCTVNPFVRQTYIEECEAIRFAAGCLVLSAYHKLSDDIRDERITRSLAARALKIILYRAFRKAGRAYREVDSVISGNMQKQIALELKKETDIDCLADPTAGCLSFICGSFAKDKDELRVLASLGGMLGRFIYLIDAADDLREDLRKGRFNPLLGNDDDGTPDEDTVIKLIDDAKRRLFVLRGEIAACYNLLDVKRYGSVLDNFIFLGLADTIARVGEKRQRKSYGSEFSDSL